jgi:hypothetical protein
MTRGSLSAAMCVCVCILVCQRRLLSPPPCLCVLLLVAIDRDTSLEGEDKIYGVLVAICEPVTFGTFV